MRDATGPAKRPASNLDPISDFGPISELSPISAASPDRNGLSDEGGLVGPRSPSGEAEWRAAEKRQYAKQGQYMNYNFSQILSDPELNPSTHSEPMFKEMILRIPFEAIF